MPYTYALPTSGLVLNLRASSIDPSTPDNAQITQWGDASGAGNDAIFPTSGEPTTPTCPVYRTQSDLLTPAGGPVIQFYDGSYRFNSNTFLDGNGSAEMMAVVRAYNFADNPGFYQFGGNDWTYYPYTGFPGYNTFDGSFTNSRYAYLLSDPYSLSIYHVYHDGTQRVCRKNGQVVHTVTAPFVDPSAADKPILRIGRTQGVPWRGHIAQFIAYNRVLTPVEREQAHNFLAHEHYGFTVPDTVYVTFKMKMALLKSALSNSAEAPALHLGISSSADLKELAAKAPAMALQAGMSSRATGGVERVSVPRIDLLLAVPAASDAVPVLAPAMALRVAMSADTVTTELTPSAPADTDVVASAKPAFVVGLDADDEDVEYTVEIQYDADDGFAHPTTLTGQATAIDGGITLAPAAAIPDGNVTWRARLLLDGVVQLDWTDPRSFTVDTSSLPVSLPVTWTVDSGATRRIHLWHVVPDGPVVGDLVTVYGQGFPATGHLVLDGDHVTYESWQRVPASIDNTVTARRIDGETVTCEHYEIVFAAPDREVGAILTVEA